MFTLLNLPESIHREIYNLILIIKHNLLSFG